MKRSEVRAEILDILESDVDPRYTDVTLFGVAESILTKLERLGMAPPVVKDTILLTESRKWETE